MLPSEACSPTSGPAGASIPPAGAVVVRTCAADRKVEIYDMFHTPGTYTPPTADFIAMTHDSYYTCILRSTILVFGIDNVEAGCMAP